MHCSLQPGRGAAAASNKVKVGGKEEEKVFGGKKSETHIACVVGDTIGDPFKDTSGPSLINILINLMSIFSLTLAPVFKDDWEDLFSGLGELGDGWLVGDRHGQAVA